MDHIDNNEALSEYSVLSLSERGRSRAVFTRLRHHEADDVAFDLAPAGVGQ